MKKWIKEQAAFMVVACFYFLLAIVSFLLAFLAYKNGHIHFYWGNGE